jgi:hypothetical protein
VDRCLSQRRESLWAPWGAIKRDKKGVLIMTFQQAFFSSQEEKEPLLPPSTTPPEGADTASQTQQLETGTLAQPLNHLVRGTFFTSIPSSRENPGN